MTARTDDHEQSSKDVWRRRILAARRALDPAVRTVRAAALTRGALALAADTGGPVCAYLPIGTEPWSPEGVEELRAAGHEVLLPVVPAGRGPLDWARHDGPGSLAPGPIGLREPSGPRLGPAAITRARLILVPGLAADRRGVRLGRGKGHYDQTLPLVATGVPLVIVIDDDELVDALPAEPHDHPMSAALLPLAGYTLLGKNG
ncbi:5-formyltetrahydrofolate cyclo-ligase [Pseudonocardia abyssalis]|uniref:5-formyltetrahydrofolate cyclo-ligase n=1 Tax=Pseudonocardia abyssalis TaxID=2792008 RepID=A0ABS6UWL5_9PSEU|nr:5-formyltetrahydrofolate cyclo-ligase [Pseudonocardia abyssalis]MBW0117162.1 5-formyltetrahydrofolate cyclo-ligase [Pseudonocardia abyssalis]MBW0136620.1 5-formyltetrahydrofolate cyclo-ligase [Pseudonocardia abyssalis]